MSFLFGSTRPEINSTVGEQYLQGPSQQVVGGLEGLTAQPYQPYDGPRIAGFNPDQLAAQQQTRDMQGIAGLGMDEAMNLTRGATGPIGAGEIQNYMNPYMSEVADFTAREMQRRSDIDRLNMRSAATTADAFGGARHGIQEAEYDRNLNRGLMDMYSQQAGQAFNTGLTAAQADRNRGLQAGAQLGNQFGQQQQQGYRDISALAGSGAFQQDQVQQNYDLARRDWEAQRDWPYERLGYATDIIGGLRTPGTGTQFSTQQKSGSFNQLAGLGIAALGEWL